MSGRRVLVSVQAREDVGALPAQVAGHRDLNHGKYTGLLQCANGTVLKPILKESQRREVDFYERLQTTEDRDLLELRRFVPKYFGTRKVVYNGHEQDYIVLEDLTGGMLQPCVMDIKIGRRTWDPLASPQKVASEEGKYVECRQQFAFCIPGYRVDTPAGPRCYGKQHGKKMKGEQVFDALREFLSAGTGVVSRSVLLRLVAALWRLQRAVRGRCRLYAASLLLAYDAAECRDCARCHHRSQHNHHQGLTRSHSFHCVIRGSSSTSTKPYFKKGNSLPLTNTNFSSKTQAIKSPWTDALDRLENNHSFKNNYEEKLNKIKLNYQTTLEQLSNNSVGLTRPTATVKIIDFAHAFFNEESDRSVDLNFKEGVDNLVNIFEMFLEETDDQLC